MVGQLARRKMKMFDTNRLYVLLSAMQKSIRWCEVNDSRYFAHQVMDMAPPRVVLNRLMIIAAEDVGLADPSLITYERECLDDFENLIEENKIDRREAGKVPEARDVVDRAVIAAAISRKSRLLAMLTFVALFDIYTIENFSQDLPEYSNRFVMAVEKGNEEEALYYAYIVGIFLDAEDSTLEMIQSQSKRRNEDLIQKWVEEYKRINKRDSMELKILLLAGSVALLCRDLTYPHGEYLEAISDHLSSPIKEAKIPDRAYDMHTVAGRNSGRGLDHFFKGAASLKNERFKNNWEDAGRAAYFHADKEGLADSSKIIETIKQRYEKYKEL